jgi:undecaprenyl-diphosphatase
MKVFTPAAFYQLCFVCMFCAKHFKMNPDNAKHSLYHLGRKEFYVDYTHNITYDYCIIGILIMVNFGVDFLNQFKNTSKTNNKKTYNKMHDTEHYSIFLYIAVCLFIAAMALSCYMIWHYQSYGQWAMDAVMQGFVKNLRTDWLTSIFRVITATGETIPVIIATITIIMALVIYKKRKEAIIAAFYMLGVWRLNDFLKQLLHRPRIDASQHLIDISSYSHNSLFSLPSGHSMNFMALILLSLYFVWIFSNNKKLNLGLTLLLLLYAILVGISRIYLNVHYSSDVITGWSLGATCAAIAVIIHTITCIKQNKYNN